MRNGRRSEPVLSALRETLKYIFQYEEADTGEAASEGVIESGKRADSFLIEDNPPEDIRNTADVKGVFAHGVWYDEQRIAEMLDWVREWAAGN